MSFSVLFVCICVLYYCQRVATQLQLTNVSYHLREHPLSCYCCRRYKFAAKSIFVQHSILSYCWHWHVAQQYTQNALLNFHGNNGQSNTPPCYVILKCLFVITFYFFPTQSNLWAILISHQETRHQRISTYSTGLVFKLRPLQQASWLRLLILIIFSTQMSVGSLTL